VVPKFFALALRGEDIVVTGKNASRDFTYIDDVTTATLEGLKRLEEAPDRIELVYNIGTGTEVFVAKLAELIVRAVESKSSISLADKRHWDNALRRVADVHKFRALFPSIANNMLPIEEGLKKSAQWYSVVCK
jgi:nucleoside-diphosphate-sugar epimerase